MGYFRHNTHNTYYNGTFPVSHFVYRQWGEQFRCEDIIIKPGTNLSKAKLYLLERTICAYSRLKDVCST